MPHEERGRPSRLALTKQAVGLKHQPCAGADAFFNCSHSKPAPVTTTGSNDPQLSQVQPCVVTNAPDANEVTAIVAKTQKLIAA